MDTSFQENAEQPEDDGKLAPATVKYELAPEDKSVLVALWGQETVDNLCSSRWQSRKESLQVILDKVEEYKKNPKEAERAKLTNAYNIMLSKLITDSVLQVFSLCIDLSRAVYSELGKGVARDAIEATLDSFIPMVLQRTGDVNQKICSTASEFILFLSNLRNVGSAYVAKFVLTPLANMNAPKALISRLTLVAQFIATHSFATEGPLTLESVMAYVCNILNNCVNKKVQQQAAQVIVEAFRQKGKDVERHLTALKPSVMKFLKTEIESSVSDVEAFQDAHEKEKEEEDVSNLEELPEEELKKIQPLIDIFGKGISCLFSKKWKLRQSALERLKQQVEAGKFVDKQAGNAVRQKFVHCCNVLGIGLDDPVPGVYAVACTIVPIVLNGFSAVIAEGDLKLCMEKIFHQLIAKNNDINVQVKQCTVDALLDVCRNNKIGPAYVSNYVMTTITNPSQWRPIVGKLEFLATLCSTFNFAGDGLSTEAVMSWTVSTFECPSGKVRSAAVNVILEVYKKEGNIVRNYISNQKPALVQELKSKIIKIARKDRTKSAPIQRLANIVQPIAAITGSLERPSTYNAAIEDEIADADTMSIRDKWTGWKRQQMKEQGIEVEPTQKEIQAQLSKEKAEKVQVKKATKRGNLVFT